MKNADQLVLGKLVEWVGSGKKSWLCTVVKTWGSSPRPVGSLLSCNIDGEIAGSLSGGCVEDDLIEKLQKGDIAEDKPEIMIYGETQEESDRFGLPCGGQLHIIIEPTSPSMPTDHLQTIVDHLEKRQCVERTVDISTGSFEVNTVPRFQHLQFRNESADNAQLKQTYGPRFQLFLIGAGPVSIYLAQMAQALDYQVLVCDPRPQMIEQWPVEGVQLVNAMPDDAVEAHADDKFSAIVALTHDPRIDDMGLMQALKTNAFFVGAMGSERTSAKRRERLLQLDLTESEIARLHAPVGLPIGSKTPAEIAISILAQLTSLRADASAELISAANG
ncbi:MAG: xanthine dehydrogenase accessory factor [Patiriisocius sp.]|jgi:xanthine dehydrogenase accessory factor